MDPCAHVLHENETQDSSLTTVFYLTSICNLKQKTHQYQLRECKVSKHFQRWRERGKSNHNGTCVHYSRENCTWYYIHLPREPTTLLSLDNVKKVPVHAHYLSKTKRCRCVTMPHHVMWNVTLSITLPLRKILGSASTSGFWKMRESEKSANEI